ncbi:MAG: hypothetical protein ISP74_07480 [Bacteroidia bacterium]|nr:hypothetical protein [Bacteroidia bacterium]
MDFCRRFFSRFLETHPIPLLHFINLGIRNPLPREIWNDRGRIPFTPVVSLERTGLTKRFKHLLAFTTD